MAEIREREKRERRFQTLMAGLVASTVINVNRRRGTRPVRPSDFLPSEPREVSPQELLAAFRGWASGINRNRSARA